MKTQLLFLKTTFFLLLLLFNITASSAQSYQDSLKKDDEDIVTSIAPYPSDVRDAILDVSQYAQKLVKIERIQARSSQSFQDLVADYPRDEQEKYYELSRYPDLVHQMLDGPPKTLEQVKPMLASYPKEVSDAVSALFPMHIADLQAMDKTYQASQKAMQNVIEDLPADAQADFKKIVGMPEVMSLLTERIDLAVSLGEAYKTDPQGTKRRLDSLSTQIAAQNQKDLDDYKKQVESDPEMQEEMKKSAQDFADSYSANGDDQSPSDAVLSQGQTAQPQVVNNYYYNGSNYNPNPYPYWFGYPYWLSYPMWYPRPLYYYTGFYFGAGGNVVVIGLPSRAYSGWFFNYGYRRYPRYYNYCNTYYSTHRAVVRTGSVYRGFRTNVNRHFSRVEHVQNRNSNFSRGATTPRNDFNRSANVSRNNSFNRPSTTVRPNTNFRNSISPSQPVNHQSFSNFHATQFHQQSWSGVRGGGNFGGGARMSGGGRSFGGGARGGRR